MISELKEVIWLWFLGFVFIALTMVACFQTYKHFAVKYEDIRRNVFESTRSYNEGKIQDLARFKLQYEEGDDKSKIAIRSVIRTMFADYKEENMPIGLQQFLKETRGY